MMFNKKGIFNWDDPKTLANLFIGLVVIALGLLPLLNYFGLIGFTLPAFLSNVVAKIALYVIAGLGIWLLIDGFLEDSHIRMITIVIALVVLVLGLIPLLSSFGVIGSVPFLSFVLQPMVFNVIFVIEGIFLIIAAFATF